jgi:hypothetical protein
VADEEFSHGWDETVGGGRTRGGQLVALTQSTE